MKFSTLVALVATASATQVQTDSQVQVESEIQSLSKSLTFLQVNPHLIATSYLKEA